MRDTWYADNRDLVKWEILLRLAGIYQARRVLQLAYYRPAVFGHLVIDGKRYDIPEEVIAHFRNLWTIGGIGSKVRVTVFDPVFRDGAVHQQATLALLPAFAQERCIVFLDPDTGLEPRNPTLEHVLGSEAQAIDVREQTLKIASGPDIAQDVVFSYVQKAEPGDEGGRHRPRQSWANQTNIL